MKLWEILPQLKEGQKLKITYKDVATDFLHQDTFVYDEGSLRREANGTLINMHRANLEADYEIIPQPVPFEEALAELRKGKTICCEYDKKLLNDPCWSGELTRLTIAPDSPHMSISTVVMLHGKWWVVN